MSDEHDKSGGKSGPERRKEGRRQGTERRNQIRWGVEDPIRRKGPGRRALDKLLRKHKRRG